MQIQGIELVISRLIGDRDKKLIMYKKTAKYYDAYYYMLDYKKASKKILALIQQHAPSAKTLLDVACGTGKHLETLRHHFDVEGLDLSREMLEIARKRCLGIPLHQGNMTNFDLGKKFDVITCLFSAIAMVKQVKKMHAAIATMKKHLNPDGLMIIEPWWTPEKYWVGYVNATHVDEHDFKMAWMVINEIKGLVSILDNHILIATPAGVEHFTELHKLGLFTHEQYLSAFQQVGLKVEYDPVGLFKRGLYIGINIFEGKPST